MDRRLQDILARQHAAQLAGLAGTEAQATIRLSDDLLNQVIAAYLPASGALRGAVVHSHEGNWLEVKVTLAKLAFLPPLTIELAIDSQPDIRADARLVLRLTGGAGGFMRMAGSLMGGFAKLPAGIRMDGDRVFVDLRALLQQHGQAALLEYAHEVCISSEEGGIAVLLIARIT